MYIKTLIFYLQTMNPSSNKILNIWYFETILEQVML